MNPYFKEESIIKQRAKCLKLGIFKKFGKSLPACGPLGS